MSKLYLKRNTLATNCLLDFKLDLTGNQTLFTLQFLVKESYSEVFTNFDSVAIYTCEIGLTYALLLLIFHSNSTVENVHSEVEEICYYYPILLQLLIELSEKFTYHQKIYLDTFRKLKLYFFLCFDSSL